MTKFTCSLPSPYWIIGNSNVWNPNLSLWNPILLNWIDFSIEIALQLVQERLRRSDWNFLLPECCFLLPKIAELSSIEPILCVTDREFDFVEESLFFLLFFVHSSVSSDVQCASFFWCVFSTFLSSYVQFLYSGSYVQFVIRTYYVHFLSSVLMFHSKV